MVRSRLQLPSLDIGPSHSMRRCEPRKPNGSVLQPGPACTAPARSGVGTSSSAWLVAAITVAELRQTPLVSRKSGWQLLGGDEPVDAGQPAPAAHPLELASAAAVRAAVLAGAGPAVMSRLAVGDDLTHGRVRAVPIADLDLRRDLRAIWMGAQNPPAGAARDLLHHIATTR